MPAQPRRADRRGDHLIVCGDGPLSYRITEELTSRYGERVTVIRRYSFRKEAAHYVEQSPIWMVGAAGSGVWTSQ